MSLLRRLVKPDRQAGETKLPVHQFAAGIAEYKRGEITGTDIASRFELSPTEITALIDWLAIINSSGKTMLEIRAEVEDVLLLGEGGIYTLEEVQTRFGL